MRTRTYLYRNGAAGARANDKAAGIRKAAAYLPGEDAGRLPPAWSRLLGRFPSWRRRVHPMIAHFPITYFLSTTFFSVLFVVTGERAFDLTAFYCLGAGLIFMPAAILSGFLTHWLNFPGEAERTVGIEKKLSLALLAVSAAAFIWRLLDPRVLHHLGGINIIYFALVMAVTPIVTANSYFGGMLTFPLEEEGPFPSGFAGKQNDADSKSNGSVW